MSANPERQDSSQFDNQFEEQRVGPIKPWSSLLIRHRQESSKATRRVSSTESRIEVFRHTAGCNGSPA